jgi:predicted phage gp36 major capsid-like protein
MYKRLVEDALRDGRLEAGALVGYTDEGLLHALEARGATPLLGALTERRLYKRAMEAPAAELTTHDLEWIAEDRERTRAAERALARSHGLAEGELLLDYPRKERMLGLDLPLLARDGSVRRITDSGLAGAINLPILAEQLYQSARWLRVFTVRRLEIPRAEVLRVLASA